MKIVLATNNKDKLKEIQEILVPMGFEVISQREAGADTEAEENGSTFAENAAIKARAAYELLHLPVIADDSGLCVDALGGAPGIYSARYADSGSHCSKLLGELSDIPDSERGAEFVCNICYIDEKAAEHFFEGKCRGSIAHSEKGSGGFGFDPVFMYGDKTFAELSAEEKNKVSHRAKALELMKKFFEEQRQQ